MKKSIFDIAGMRCGTCAVGIELALTKKKGIENAKVSLNEKTATVEYNPEVLTTSDITKVVNDLGYNAILSREK